LRPNRKRGDNKAAAKTFEGLVFESTVKDQQFEVTLTVTNSVAKYQIAADQTG